MKDGTVLNEKECVSPEEAIRAITADAAFQCHMDDIVGTIEKGKMADFVILDQDPMKIDPKQLINLKVMQTWMDGNLVYDALKKEWSIIIKRPLNQYLYYFHIKIT